MGALIERQPPNFPQEIFTYDRFAITNPYGVLAAGYEWEPSARWRIQLELRHESSWPRHDAGEDGAWFKVRLYPFRAR